MERFSDMLRTNREEFVAQISTKIQYFTDNSSLPSIGYVISLSRTHILKRLRGIFVMPLCRVLVFYFFLGVALLFFSFLLFWLVTFTACCYSSAIVLRGALGLYMEDAVTYSVETDYLQWDTTFPAVTICEQLNETKAASAILRNYPASLIRFGKDVAFWNFKVGSSCVNCKINISCIENFLPIVDIARSPCSELMTDCWYNGEYFPCCERFKPVPTEYGVCFVFNSELTGDGQLKVSREVGMPTLLFSLVGKVMIKVHSPEEKISVGSENILGSCYTLLRGSNFEVNLLAEEIINDISVRTISPSSRDCLFEDERPEDLEGWPFEEYSYSGCVWYCRTMAQVKLCNCSYHFMPRIENVPMCNIEGLKCLYKNKGSIEVDPKCHCPMSCAEVSYKAVYLSCPPGNDSHTTRGSVRIGQLPHLRVRRHAIRDKLGLVVDIGGVVGVFFGASLLSFIEIVYIFFIRKFSKSKALVINAKS